MEEMVPYRRRDPYWDDGEDYQRADLGDCEG